jgi:hypothetical protein
MLALRSDPLVALGGKGNALWSVGSHESLLPRPNGNIHILRGQLPQVTITAAGTQSIEVWSSLFSSSLSSSLPGVAREYKTDRCEPLADFSVSGATALSVHDK